MISFTVDGVPAPKGSMRAFRTARGKVAMRHDNDATAPWAMRVGWVARKEMAGKPPIAGPVMVRLHFYLPRPKSVKRALPSVKPDVDKLTRAVFDALTGIVWVDDGQIVQVMGQKAYADADEAPHVHIIVMDLDAAAREAEEQTP